MSERLPFKETVARLREQYPKGARVELLSMDDPYTTLKPGARGTVSFVDDTGTIFVDWDNGSGLGVAYGADKVKRLENEIKCETGADFWRDIAVRFGLEEASVICGNYLNTQLRADVSQDEETFCRELFAAMVEATAGRADPDKIVYPYSFEEAVERDEAEAFHDGFNRNQECAQAIDQVIRDSCYKTNFYNLELAAMKALHEHGFQRVNMVLAHNIHKHEYDGRYTKANKEWAASFEIPGKAFDGAYLRSHPILIDGFAERARELYVTLHAERFELPGRNESGHAVQGYEILRSILFDNRRGFALGHNPDAVQPFVCWQFTLEDGRRNFYWGRYSDTGQAAQNDYRTRVMLYMRESTAKEAFNPLAAMEMSTEQNYNMIDGLRNNMAHPKADLTDGQTHEEVRELAPQTLQDEKPSVLEQIREAKKAPPTAHRPGKTRDKGAPELEL